MATTRQGESGRTRNSPTGVGIVEARKAAAATTLKAAICITKAAALKTEASFVENLQEV